MNGMITQFYIEDYRPSSRPPINYIEDYKKPVPSSTSVVQAGMTDLPQDIIGVIFWRSFNNNDITGIQALACTSKHFYKYIPSFGEKITREQINQICPLLRIYSAEEAQECGFKAITAPHFNKLKIIRDYQEMAPHVESDEGVSYFDFIIPEDMTYNQLVEIAGNQGIKIDAWSQISIEIGNKPVEQIVPMMITNSVFKNTRSKSYDVQCEQVKGHKCDFPPVESHIKLIILAQKIDNRCLYGQNPWTYGRSSTIVHERVWFIVLERALAIGGSAPGRLYVSSFDFVNEDDGAGGQRK